MDAILSMLPLDPSAADFQTKLAVTAGAAVMAFGLLIVASGAPRRNKGRPTADPDTLPGVLAPRTTEKKGECVPVLAKTGVAARKPRTVMSLFKQCKDKDAGSMAFRQEVPGAPGTFKSWTWNEYWVQTHEFAQACIKLADFKTADVVNIIGFNSPEWFLANMGAIAAGGIAAGIYTTNAPNACAYITRNSEAKVVVVDGQKQLDKYLELRDSPDTSNEHAVACMKTVKAIVVYNDDGVDFDKCNKKRGKCKVYSWDDFLAAGRGDASLLDECESRQSAAKPGHCCLMIYTSGTTGNPKGVMLSHDNITFLGSSVLSCEPWAGKDGRVERVLSYLPLSHVAGNLIDMQMALAVGSQRTGRLEVTFARPDALKGSLPMSLQATKPTIFLGVPRVWEKISEKIKAKGKAAGDGLLRKVINFFKAKGLAYAEGQEVGGSGVVPWGLFLAEAIVFKKVKGALGLTTLRHGFTGAAPIARETQQFFGALGVQVNEAYGMSESCGATTWSNAKCFKWGKCGWALPGTELMILHEPGRDKEGEGEICFRGRHIMMGYLNNEKKTKEAVDGEGWLHSGDVGKIDADGFLSITGRIKELIITAGGENIAPVPIEDEVKKLAPGISNIVMIGDKKKYNTCLITLKVADDGEGGFTNELVGEAAEVDKSCKTVDDARASEKWTAYLTKALKDYNEGPVCVARAQRIQKFTILDADFSVPGGQLTATLKTKRPVVAAMYAKEIEAMY